MKLFKYPITGTKTLIRFFLRTIRYFTIGLITIISIIPYYLYTGLKFIFSKKTSKNPEIQKLEKKFIPLTILTLAITTYLISIFILTRWYVQNERTKNFTNNFNTPPITSETNLDEESTDEITKDTPDQYEDSTTITPVPETPTIQDTTSNNPSVNANFMNVDLNYYLQKNSETVGWLQVNGTKINYPIVQHADNDFYLKHDFYQRQTNNGWIFGDYRNNFEIFDNNTIIYGHNLINNSMFGTLTYLSKESFFNNKNNHYIKLSTKNTNTIWQIFSVYKIEPTTDYLQAKFNSTTAYQEFLTKLKNRSYYNFNLDLNYTDKIITLSTCTSSGTKRFVVHAKLINIESK